MRAIQVVRLDGPSAVEPGEVPEPSPADGQVLIEAHVAGVNFPDVLLTRGTYQHRPTLPFVLGSEVAGVVRWAPTGAGVSPGDRVAAFVSLAGFQELVTAPVGSVFPIPERLSFAAAAALPMNYFTAEYALGRRGRLQPGETVLVHGAAGGVGTAAVQVAKALGATVIGVVSNDEKARVAARAGADHAVPASDFLASVTELTDGAGVDVVVDPVGGDRFLDSLRCLRPEGRLLVVGFTAGEIPTVKVNRLLLRNIDVVGVAWGEFGRANEGFLQHQWASLVPHLADGRIAPVLGGSYELADAGAALAELEDRRALGKVTLRVR